MNTASPTPWPSLNQIHKFPQCKLMIDRTFNRGMLSRTMELDTPAWLWGKRTNRLVQATVLLLMIAPLASLGMGAVQSLRHGRVPDQLPLWVCGSTIAIFVTLFVVLPGLRFLGKLFGRTQSTQDFTNDQAALQSIPIEWISLIRAALGRIHGLRGEQIHASHGAWGLWHCLLISHPLKAELIIEVLARLDAEVWYEPVMERLTVKQTPWPTNAAGIIACVYEALGELSTRPIPKPLSKEELKHRRLQEIVDEFPG